MWNSASSTTPYGVFSMLWRRSLRTTSCWFVELLLIEHVEQVAHAIGLEPQPELELVRRQRLEVVRAIEVGRAVEVRAARRFEQLEVRVARHVLRALEHHVLEQVREARAARRLVGRTDVIPEIDRDERQPMIRREDHLEAVRRACTSRIRSSGCRRRRRAPASSWRRADCPHPDSPRASGAIRKYFRRSLIGDSSPRVYRLGRAFRPARDEPRRYLMRVMVVMTTGVTRYCRLSSCTGS